MFSIRVSISAEVDAGLSAEAAPPADAPAAMQTSMVESEPGEFCQRLLALLVICGRYA